MIARVRRAHALQRRRCRQALLRALRPASAACAARRSGRRPHRFPDGLVDANAGADPVDAQSTWTFPSFVLYIPCIAACFPTSTAPSRPAAAAGLAGRCSFSVPPRARDCPEPWWPARAWATIGRGLEADDRLLQPRSRTFMARPAPRRHRVPPGGRRWPRPSLRRSVARRPASTDRQRHTPRPCRTVQCMVPHAVILPCIQNRLPAGVSIARGQSGLKSPRFFTTAQSPGHLA